MGLETLVLLLAKLGFRKRAGHVFTLDLAPNVLGWLGLNRATRHLAAGEVEINPVIGVRFQEVERLVAECRGEKFHAYQPSTISSPLGYLMPEKKYKAWVFAPGRSETVATDMTNAIAMHGVAFMRSVVDLDELRKLLRGEFGLEHQLAYRRPTAALVAGEPEQARALLDEALAAIGARTDLAAAEFRKFAASLRSRLLPRSFQ
ncbi:hypothetical protein [Corallococcus exercitus]|uniref:hypothetical protein n=1 Tax=Corallococcus exercitus TaxID=2316736 RepID=UPI0035D41A7F